MRFSRVINNEICYHAKEVYNVYSLFHTRYNLFKQVYSHRVGKAIEYMVSDVLLLADPYLKISEKTRSPESYTYLTDSILQQIEGMLLLLPVWEFSSLTEPMLVAGSSAPELKAARDLLKRFRKRDLYKMADEIVLPSKHDLIPELKKLTLAQLVNYAPSDANLREEDVIIDDFKCNYGSYSVTTGCLLTFIRG
jgi:HD superfamily phosphohydrolase